MENCTLILLKIYIEITQQGIDRCFGKFESFKCVEDVLIFAADLIITIIHHKSLKLTKVRYRCMS